MKWVESRKGELLPIDYHHVVFTIPEQLNDLVLRNKPLLYKNPVRRQRRHSADHCRRSSPPFGAANLVSFPYCTAGDKICCFIPISTAIVVTGGGISLDGTLLWSLRNPSFLPAGPGAVPDLFRRLFLEALRRRFGKISSVSLERSWRHSRNPPWAFFELTSSLRRIEWVVYSKPPFGGAHRVLEYPRPLYAPRRPSTTCRILDAVSGRRQGDVSVQTVPLRGQCPQIPHDDSRCRRVHPPVPAPLVALRASRAFGITVCSPGARKSRI